MNQREKYKKFIQETSPKHISKLEKEMWASGIIGAFLGSLVFLSPNLTGNAVLVSSFKISNFLGAGLFIIGIVAALFYFQRIKS
jgi:hypothetical protein